MNRNRVEKQRLEGSSPKRLRAAGDGGVDEVNDSHLLQAFLDLTLFARIDTGYYFEDQGEQARMRSSYWLIGQLVTTFTLLTRVRPSSACTSAGHFAIYCQLKS